MPKNNTKPLRIPEGYNTEQLLQFFSKYKKNFNPVLLTVLLNQLSRLITDETLILHKMDLLDILKFSEEFEINWFDKISIATLFNVFAKWPSLMTEPLCEKIIENFLQHIADHADNFNGQSISIILHSLAKYPPLANSSYRGCSKKAIGALLQNIPKELDSQTIVLISLAFCYFSYFRQLEFNTHKKTIIELLGTLELKKLPDVAINQLQQIFIYAPELIQCKKDALHLAKISREDFIYEEDPLSPESSSLHKNVYACLKQCHLPESFGEFINEYRIGHTFVDIANPEKHLCIQVNGPSHYIGEGKRQRLNNKSQFAQHLLKKQGWKVLTINYKDWQTMSSTEKKIYLSGLLAPYFKRATSQNPIQQEQAMPSFSIIERQLAIQQQQLAIQQQQLQIQQQQLFALQMQPPMSQYPHSTTVYSAPVYYFPMAPYPYQPITTAYSSTTPHSTIPSYSTDPHSETPSPLSENTTLNYGRYDRHTNFFRPPVTPPIEQTQSDPDQHYPNYPRWSTNS
jgi:very-short-patch-repair endonuclease